VGVVSTDSGSTGGSGTGGSGTGSGTGGSGGSGTGGSGTGGSATAPGQTLGVARSGNATFYSATGAGHCSFDATPHDLMVAAMNRTDYAGSYACGSFVTVKGPLGTVTVRITDECPECPKGHIDLSAQAFAKIAKPVTGIVPITWTVVPGDVQGPIQYRYKEGSTRYWTAIQVRNHKLPITKLEIMPSGSKTWINVSRMDYNYFVYAPPIAAGSVQVRVTAEGGATLQDVLPEPKGGLVVNGRGQFP
jgi:expansin (peptidoglycan-binding protein)